MVELSPSVLLLDRCPPGQHNEGVRRAAVGASDRERAIAESRGPAWREAAEAFRPKPGADGNRPCGVPPSGRDFFHRPGNHGHGETTADASAVALGGWLG